jgi:F-type H+-transporting ATPase subunit epsilon
MKCDIVSARRTVYSGTVSMVVAPGAAGELGITPGHAPLMTTLRAGAIRVLNEQREENTFLIGGGIIEVMPHLVTVLVDTAVRAADFDEQAVRRAKENAERALLERSESRDIVEIQVQLRDAVEKLQALERWRKRVKHKG